MASAFRDRKACGCVGNPKLRRGLKIIWICAALSSLQCGATPVQPPTGGGRLDGSTINPPSVVNAKEDARQIKVRGQEVEMFRSEKGRTIKKRQPDFIDLEGVFSSVEPESFYWCKYRMRSRSGAGAGGKKVKFICIIDPRKTNLQRVTRQFQSDGLKIAHSLEFINTLVVIGDPAKMRTCVEQIGGIICLVRQGARRARWMALPAAAGAPNSGLS